MARHIAPGTDQWEVKLRRMELAQERFESSTPGELNLLLPLLLALRGDRSSTTKFIFVHPAMKCPFDVQMASRVLPSFVPLEHHSTGYLTDLDVRMFSAVVMLVPFPDETIAMPAEYVEPLLDACKEVKSNHESVLFVVFLGTSVFSGTTTPPESKADLVRCAMQVGANAVFFSHPNAMVTYQHLCLQMFVVECAENIRHVRDQASEQRIVVDHHPLV